MATKFFVSSACFYCLARRPPRKLNVRHLSSLATTLQSELPRGHNLRTKTRSSSFRLMAAAAGGDAESIGAPRSVPVRVAHELLQAGHRYLDVRTTEEFSAGHVPGAINIPYMLRAGAGMTKNPKFLEEVSSQFGKDDEIVVGCQSGKRSLMAVTDLLSAGYRGLTDVAGGYAAWAQNGLPAEQ